MGAADDVTRTNDSSGDDFLTYLTGGGKMIQPLVLVDSDGNELKGQAAMASSLPTVIASDQTDVPVATPGKGFEMTPTLDTGAYAVGDVLFATVTLTDAVRANGGTAALHSISVLDKGKVSGDFDLILLASNVNVGAANAALSMSDAEAVDVLHYIQIVGDDYIDIGDQTYVPLPNVGMGMMADSAVDNLYLAGVSQGTETYAADGLVIRLYFMQDHG